MGCIRMEGLEMKRLLSTAVLSTMILTIATPAFAEEGSVQLADKAKSAVLIERDTGNILYDKNSDEKRKNAGAERQSFAKRHCP